MELNAEDYAGLASDEERVDLGKPWQDRVRRIFENSASVIELF